MKERKTTRIDMHIHTRGSDGWGKPKEIVAAAIDANLDGICVCDHHVTHTKDGDAVLKVAQDAGLLAFPGCEYTTEWGHVLIFGFNVRKEEFGRYPHPQEVINKVVAAGGVAIPAHPYRSGNRKIMGQRVLGLKRVRAYETCNGHAALWGDRQNEKARTAAKQGKKQSVGGSDAHRPSEVGICYTLFQGRIMNEQQFLRALQRGKFHGVIARQRIAEVSRKRWSWPDTKPVTRTPVGQLSFADRSIDRDYDPSYLRDGYQHPDEAEAWRRYCDDPYHWLDNPSDFEDPDEDLDNDPESGHSPPYDGEWH